MVQHIQPEESGSADYARRVLLALEHGILDQPDVARHLGCSVATLRRRLTVENTSFRQLTKDSLNDKAKQLILQGFHISEIAEELGFSDFRSFIRAFKNWNNMTPNTYEKTLDKK